MTNKPLNCINNITKMKNYYLFLSSVLLVFIAGCSKNNIDKNADKEARDYVAQLISGQFTATSIPDLKKESIPTLLMYSKDTTAITKFPVNPISSYRSHQNKLGLVVLWTVESIRQFAEKNVLSFTRYPSQNALLGMKDPVSGGFISDYQAQLAVANAYIEWWENNSNRNFKSFRDINPMDQTIYRWR